VSGAPGSQLFCKALSDLNELSGFGLSTDRHEEPSQLRSGLLVERVSLEELACVGDRVCGVARQSGHDCAQNRQLLLKRIFPRTDKPGLEIVVVRQLQAFQEGASEDVRDILELLQDKRGHSKLKSLAKNEKVDLRLVRLKVDGLSIRDDSRLLRLIDKLSDLAETPAKASFRIVRNIPKQLHEPFPTVSPGGCD
jgi:hypothetical protein